jgi:hypothetical protein
MLQEPAMGCYHFDLRLTECVEQAKIWQALEDGGDDHGNGDDAGEDDINKTFMTKIS